MTPELDAAIQEGYAQRDRENMQPTIDYFHDLLNAHPDNPFLLYEVGGAHDTAGDEERARGYYEQAIDAGLDGDALRRCLLQYGSTLRNLGLHQESLAALRRARAEFPDSDSIRLFLALSLHAASRSDAAVAEFLELAADRIRTPEVMRYEAALRGNAAYLAHLDKRGATTSLEPSMRDRHSPDVITRPKSVHSAAFSRPAGGSLGENHGCGGGSAGEMLPSFIDLTGDVCGGALRGNGVGLV